MSAATVDVTVTVELETWLATPWASASTNGTVLTSARSVNVDEGDVRSNGRHEKQAKYKYERPRVISGGIQCCTWRYRMSGMLARYDCNSNYFLLRSRAFAGDELFVNAREVAHQNPIYSNIRHARLFARGLSRRE